MDAGTWAWRRVFTLENIFLSYFLMLTLPSSEPPNVLDFFTIYPQTHSASERPEYEGPRQIPAVLSSLCCFSKFMWCLSPRVKAVAAVL